MFRMYVCKIPRMHVCMPVALAASAIFGVRAFASMYVCMYVCMYVYICTYISCMHTCMYLCMYAVNTARV